MEKSYLLKKILRVVPTKFVQIVSTIEQFGAFETMSVEETIGRLKAHEERARGHGDSSGKHLLLTQEEWKVRSKKGAAHGQSSNQKVQNGYN